MEIVEIYLRNIFSNKAGFYLKHSVEEIKKIYKAYIIHESKKLFTLFDSK